MTGFLVSINSGEGRRGAGRCYPTTRMCGCRDAEIERYGSVFTVADHEENRSRHKNGTKTTFWTHLFIEPSIKLKETFVNSVDRKKQPTEEYSFSTQKPKHKIPNM